MSQRGFRIMGVATLAALFLLIVVGASVRAAGAGMGCPDWPKCFGMWIPPTDVSQLPENYMELYAVQGEAIEPFNAFKTWTEYVNRLTGATVGLMALITLALSFTYWKTDKAVPFWAFMLVFFTGLAGWLGKELVASNLSPTMITIHLLPAFGTVAALILALARANRPALAEVVVERKGVIQSLVVACLVMSVIQLLLGTLVRDEIIAIAAQLGDEQRDLWTSRLDKVFYIHRSGSWLVLIGNAALLFFVFKHAADSLPLKRTAVALFPADPTIEVVGCTDTPGEGRCDQGFPAREDVFVIFGNERQIFLKLIGNLCHLHNGLALFFDLPGLDERDCLGGRSGSLSRRS